MPKRVAKPKLNGRHVAANEAPLTFPVLAPEVMERNRRSRFNPLRNLTPENLSTALDSFDAGQLRSAALLWQKIADRDDTIVSVKPKRELSTAHRPWQVIMLDESPEAMAQKAVLEWFWNHITAENAFDRNDCGGFTKFAQQVMEAVSYKYAVHHIVWEPRPEELIDLGNGQSITALTAKLEYVPLQFFENTTGRLRFIEDGMGIYGKPMMEGEWITTVGPGLMIACSIGYMFKRLSYNDWIVFSEKFGMPGVLGRTGAAKDSDAGDAMRAAVESFGNEWSGVIYGDDGSGKIELIMPNGGSQNIPMPSLIERIDRKLATIYRGADLSTMSSGDGSQGRGASIQREETDIFDRADATMMSEALNKIDRLVVRYQLGSRSPKAYTQLILPESKDLQFILSAIVQLVGLGLPVAITDVRELFGLTAPKEGEELLSVARMGAGTFGTFQPGAFNAVANSARDRIPLINGLMSKARELLASSLSRDLKPLRQALAEVVEGPEAGLPDRLAILRRAYPRIVREVFRNEEAAKAFERASAAALFTGLTQKQ
jgi:phage gp29-like protein